MTKKEKLRILSVKILFVLILIVAATIPAWGCSSLIAGKDATTDGSTMISYAADSHVLYGALKYFPAADHQKDAMREIREWDTNKHLGYIPEVAHTYSVVGNMNEHQLAITESTWECRPELDTPKGMIDYGSLIFIALQRCKTAREAIQTMTSLVEKYGYCSSGESFSIADPNEIWVLELVGKGQDEKGAVWVAVRIPDNAISGHANLSRIHQFPLNDKKNCIYSKDVISFARKKGYFNGKDSEFSFSKAYAVTDFGALRGCDARVWSFFNRFKSGMERYLPYINGKAGSEVMPLYVIPDRKLSVSDMKSMMRDHFEGTPFDMTQDIGAGPWKVPYRFRPMTFKVDGIEYTNERAIATQQTGFSLVAQMRKNMPDVIGGILWFGVDDANTCVYLPMYCSMTRIPHEYSEENGDLYTLSWDAAFWVNNWVANQAYSRYSLMIPDIRKVQTDIENSIEMNQSVIENEAMQKYAVSPVDAAKFLNDYSCCLAKDATTRYKKLGEYLLVKFLDGNMKKEKDGQFLRSADGYPESPYFPGYDERYYRSIVNDAGERLKVVQPEE